MPEKPTTPEDCPICHRIDAAIETLPVITQKLSTDDIAEVKEKLHSAVFDREMKKTLRGNNMAEELYVIEKEAFKEFLETQSILVAIIEKMADRIEVQDEVIRNYGSVLTDAVAKGMDPFAPADGMEPEMEEEEVSEDMPEDAEEDGFGAGAEPEVPAIKEPSLEGDAIEGDSVEGEEGEEDFTKPSGGELKAIAASAFKAGWDAKEAEAVKKQGLPVQLSQGNFKYPEMKQPVVGRAAVGQAQQLGGQGMMKDLSMEKLAYMTPAQLSAALRGKTVAGVQ